MAGAAGRCGLYLGYLGYSYMVDTNSTFTQRLVSRRQSHGGSDGGGSHLVISFLETDVYLQTGLCSRRVGLLD